MTDTAKTDKNPITPEMIEAGASVVFDLREDATAWELAEAVYRAMERAKYSESNSPSRAVF